MRALESEFKDEVSRAKSSFVDQERRLKTTIVSGVLLEHRSGEHSVGRVVAEGAGAHEYFDGYVRESMS